jgi:hypothetical protein
VERDDWTKESVSSREAVLVRAPMISKIGIPASITRVIETSDSLKPSLAIALPFSAQLAHALYRRQMLVDHGDAFHSIR